jgi:light-regulated signal transduction histidine kinase (bacteriophytochrome)
MNSNPLDQGKSREQLQQEVDALRARLEQLERTENEVLSVASHDLGQPLRTITSFAQKLAGLCGEQLPEKGRDCLTRIVNGAERMRPLLEALSAYAHAGRSRPGRDVEFRAVFGDACAALHTLVAACGADVTAGELPRVRGDSAQLGQLLRNLIGNALKFRAERAPVIRVEARRHGEDWLFTVTDNGIGIESQYLQRIFRVGGESRLDARIPGSGFGLATCERIVRVHQGRIWAESPGPDHGTTIAFTLPIVPTTPDPAG